MKQTTQTDKVLSQFQLAWEDELPDVVLPIAGDAGGKNLLSMRQLMADDIYEYIEEARAAERFRNDPLRRGLSLLPFTVLQAVMRQPSTRTGGSMVTAMEKLGGSAQLISGMSSSSEAKGESVADSWAAFATQSDILGIRTAEDDGPTFAAQIIAMLAKKEKLPRTVPVINLGDGRNEHPTQALGDFYTIQKYKKLKGLTMAVVGDHERYRAFHSLIIGAASLGMNIIAVESPAAPVPQYEIDLLGDRLQRTGDLDEAMREADVLYVGRNPDEYDGSDPAEQKRSLELAAAYKRWAIDHKRLQQMRKDAIVLHPRPRRNELHPSLDGDPRMKDVEQMDSMIPMRMAIIARHMGLSVAHAA